MLEGSGRLELWFFSWRLLLALGASFALLLLLLFFLFFFLLLNGLDLHFRIFLNRFVPLGPSFGDLWLRLGRGLLGLLLLLFLRLFLHLLDGFRHGFLVDRFRRF